MRRFVPVVLFIALMVPTLLRAQTGESVYQFLELPMSTVAASQGGQSVASPVSDLNLVFHNPALLGADLHNQFAVGYLNYIADINAGSAAYAREINANSRWMAGIRYVDYGTMPWTSPSNELLGETSAQDLALTGTYAWTLSPYWQAGGNFNLIYSVLDEYTSAAVAVDLGVYYRSPDQLTSFGMTLMHLGSQIVRYDDTYEGMPWDIRLGLSRKLEHAPLRFNVTAQHLNQRSMTYLVEDNLDNLSWSEQIFTRVIGGVDFLPSDNFMLSLGYNYRRVRELGIAQRTFFGGFSAGMMLRIKQMTAAASYARYHAGGNSLQMTLSFNASVFGL